MPIWVQVQLPAYYGAINVPIFFDNNVVYKIAFWD